MLKYKRRIYGTYKKKYKGGAAASDNFLVTQTNILRTRIKILLKGITEHTYSKNKNVHEQMRTIKMLLENVLSLIDNINTNSTQNIESKLREIQLSKDDLLEIISILSHIPDTNNEMLQADKTKLSGFIRNAQIIIDIFIQSITPTPSARVAAKYANAPNNNAKPTNRTERERLAAKYANEPKNNAKNAKQSKNVRNVPKSKVLQKLANAKNQNRLLQEELP